jgi:hypothetical protein
MNTSALLFGVCGGMALLALVCTVLRLRVARRLAQSSLWLTLAGVPVVLALDVVRLWLADDGAHSSAFLLGKSISHALNYGTIALPCAALAALALRRATAHRVR